jgi:chromosome segregation ATPase
MHTKMTRVGMILTLAAALPHAGQAAEEDTTARLREMLHRTQEALRQAQSDNADLTRAKADSEQKLKDAGARLDAQQSGAKAAQSSLNAKLTAAQGTEADLTGKLGDAGEKLKAADARLGDLTKQLAARQAELDQTKRGLEQSTAANASCEAKNLTLYGYAEDVLEAYRKKGVFSALAQKEPVLGLKEVGVENVVQEYRLKFASQKVKP